MTRGVASHFGHEYIIKLSKENLVPYQLNPMPELKSRDSLI